tara:strand:+ start:1126 stop:1812 length:687 start_codon:yes stop_codon:yes gene_type:complete
VFSKEISDCSYILFPDILKRTKLPKGVYNNIEKFNFKNFNCPSVNNANDKVFFVNSFINLEVEFGLKNDEPYYNYFLDSKTSVINDNFHKIVKDMLQVSYINKIINIQLLSPYAFVTDDKDLQVTTTSPNMKNENCYYVSGSIKPYSWIRNLNSAWTLINKNKPGKLYFNLNDAFLNFVFNKNVNLNYIEPNQKIINYINQNLHVVAYRKNLNKIYKNVLSRRPKNLL